MFYKDFEAAYEILWRICLEDIYIYIAKLWFVVPRKWSGIFIWSDLKLCFQTGLLIRIYVSNTASYGNTSRDN